MRVFCTFLTFYVTCTKISLRLSSRFTVDLKLISRKRADFCRSLIEYRFQIEYRFFFPNSYRTGNISFMKQQFVLSHRYTILQKKRKLDRSSVDKQLSILRFHENVRTRNVFVDTTFWHRVCL